MIETLFVIILVGILAVFTISNVGRNDDAIKVEVTRARMEALRIAIVGDEASTDREGKRQNFGYFGDVGIMPTVLDNLVTRPSGMATWFYTSAYGFALGWHGPYLVSTVLTADKGFEKDGWGRFFTFSTGATPQLTSLGSDGSAGGTSYAKDLTMDFPGVARLGSVAGVLEDFNARLSGRTVELVYPSSAVLTSVTAITDANGFFKFQTVPFGIRSLRPYPTTSFVPRQITLDRDVLNVPNSLLNLFGTSEGVSYVASSLFKTNGGANVFISLASTYTTDVQLDAITASVSGGFAGTYSTVKLNGVSESFSATANGVRVDLTADMVAPASSSQNSLEIDFSAAPTGGTTLSLTFEWLHRSRVNKVDVTL